MKYRPDIDGLRAIAVISILFSHVGVSLFSGGYVGVDIFFVISGFLITAIITEEIQQHRFSLVTFYERRVRRLFPALFVMMWITTIGAYFILLPIHFKDYGESMVATALFGSNILFWRESGYFSEASELKPLLHTWSLGVEEQFYVSFPILLLFIYRYFKGYLYVWIITLSLLSLLLSYYGVLFKPIATFFLLPTRAWEFFLGALLALGVFPKLGSQKIANILSSIGLGFIFYAVMIFTDKTSFPGMNALFPVIGTFLIIYSGIHYTTRVSKLLSFKILVFIGLISYSLYLWHWPIYVFYVYYISRELFFYELVAIIISSFLLAILSWKYIETPFRKKILLYTKKQLFSGALLVVFIASTVGGYLHITKGYPNRLDSSIRTYILKNELAMSSWEYPAEFNNFKNSLRNASDMNYYVRGEDRKGKILFWGDSHVGMIFSAINEVFDNNRTGYKVIIGTSDGCLAVREFNRIDNGYYCNRFNDLLFSRVMEDDIDIVFIGNRWDYIGNGIDKKGNGSGVLALEAVEHKFKSDITQMISRGKKVYIIATFPRFNDSVPLTLEKRYLFGRKEEPELRQQGTKIIDEVLIRVARETGAILLDPKNILCNNNEECIYEKDGISIYKDSNHLNTDGALMMTEMFVNIFKKESLDE